MEHELTAYQGTNVLFCQYIFNVTTEKSYNIVEFSFLHKICIVYNADQNRHSTF